MHATYHPKLSYLARTAMVLLCLTLAYTTPTYSAVIQVCGGDVRITGDTSGARFSTYRDFSYVSGMYARGEDRTIYGTQQSMPPSNGSCTWCTEQFMMETVAGRLAGPGLSVRSGMLPIQGPETNEFVFIIAYDHVGRNYHIRTLHLPITDVVGCPVTCNLTADPLVDFGTIPSNDTTSRTIVLPANVSCTDNATVRVSLVSPSGTDTIQLGSTIRGKLSVSGVAGDKGYDYKVVGTSPTPIFPQFTLLPMSVSVPGVYTAAAILEIRVQ